MPGFKTEVIMASILAVITATLLGVTTYMLSPHIEISPVLMAKVDAYTEKGGYGPSILSTYYLYNENVSIFANVTDATNRPLADIPVKFEINGPPNSDILLLEHAVTNEAGIAVANVTAPYQRWQPATVLGIWTAVATTNITGTQIVDSLVFEVKAPPSARDPRFIDVYTDRGGNGPNTSSQSYARNETVNLYARVSDGTNPIVGSSVVVAAYWPDNKLILLTTRESNASGISTASFRIPPVKESIGEWRVIVTVRINDQVFLDALNFECRP